MVQFSLCTLSILFEVPLTTYVQIDRPPGSEITSSQAFSSAATDPAEFQDDHYPTGDDTTSPEIKPLVNWTIGGAVSFVYHVYYRSSVSLNND